MTVTLYAATGILLFCLGLIATMTHPNLVRKLLALNVASSGVFLVFVAFAYRNSGAPDPVAHAMVLTGIVVSVSATGLGLALIKRIEAATGCVELPAVKPDNNHGTRKDAEHNG